MIARALVLGLALLVWQLWAHTYPSPALPGPDAVIIAAAAGFSDGSLTTDILASLQRVFVGFALAATAGIGLGTTLSLLGPRAQPLHSLVDVLRPIPPIAWVPLAILWFGLGDGSAWFIVFVGAFFPIFVQVSWALSSCPPRYLELAHSLGASSRLTLLRIRIPAAAPGIASGLRTGLGLAWTSVIAAELVGAQSGLGYRIQMHRLVLETEGVIAGMLCIGALGLAMDSVARRIQQRLIHWETT